MGKLIVAEFVTLDGVMEAPGGEPSHPHTGWVGDYFSPELEEYKFQETAEAEALLIGRETFESFREGWTPREGAFADKMNTMPKFVVSATMDDPGWNATVLTGDLEAAVRQLKASIDGPILTAGSATLVHDLLRMDVVDELRLMIFPVSIGHGLRVFDEARDRVAFEFAGTQTFPNGVLLTTYHPVAAIQVEAAHRG